VLARIEPAGAVGKRGRDARRDALGRIPHLFVEQRRRAVRDVAVGQADANDPR
jgi:hypothetical protein